MTSETYGLCDFQIERFKRVYSRRMIREEANLFNAQIFQDLCPDAVIVELSVTSFPFRRLKINIFFLHNGVCTKLIHEIKIVLALTEIKDDTAFFF